jgi:hypothetical protein
LGVKFVFDYPFEVNKKSYNVDISFGISTPKIEPIWFKQDIFMSQCVRDLQPNATLVENNDGLETLFRCYKNDGYRRFLRFLRRKDHNWKRSKLVMDICGQIDEAINKQL